MFRTVPLSIIRSFSLYTQQWYMSERFTDSLRAESGTGLLTYTITVCTVKNSWWWTEELSETCRILFQKQIWEVSASVWFYYKNLSRYTVTWTSNLKCPVFAAAPIAAVFRAECSAVPIKVQCGYVRRHERQWKAEANDCVTIQLIYVELNCLFEMGPRINGSRWCVGNILWVFFFVFGRLHRSLCRHHFGCMIKIL